MCVVVSRMQEFISNNTKLYNDNRHGYWIGYSGVEDTWTWTGGSNGTLTLALIFGMAQFGISRLKEPPSNQLLNSSYLPGSGRNRVKSMGKDVLWLLDLTLWTTGGKLAATWRTAGSVKWGPCSNKQSRLKYCLLNGSTFLFFNKTEGQMTNSFRRMAAEKELNIQKLYPQVLFLMLWDKMFRSCIQSSNFLCDHRSRNACPHYLGPPKVSNSYSFRSRQRKEEALVCSLSRGAASDGSVSPTSARLQPRAVPLHLHQQVVHIHGRRAWRKTSLTPQW